MKSLPIRYISPLCNMLVFTHALSSRRTLIVSKQGEGNTFGFSASARRQGRKVFFLPRQYWLLQRMFPKPILPVDRFSLYIFCCKVLLASFIICCSFVKVRKCNININMSRFFTCCCGSFCLHFYCLNLRAFV